VHGFKAVRTTAGAGSSDKLALGALNYVFSQVGQWQ
jgi:hypothetical protein